jgi:integrase
MPRHVRDARIETREARRRLPVQSEPHWRAIVQGAHLGYYKGARSSAWLVRWRNPAGGYQKAKLGEADDIRDPDGQRVLDYRQAQQKALEQVAKWERPDEPEAGEPEAAAATVEAVVREYLDWTTKHRKATTAREWKYMAGAHILPALGKIEVAKLTTAQLRKWHEGVAAQPARLRTSPKEAQRYREQSNDPDAVRARRATANRNLTVLKAALNHWWDEEGGKLTCSDEAWRRVKPFRGADAARVRYLQLAECKRFLNACAKDFRKLARGGLETGARYSELCGADVGDFNPDAKCLQIRESKGDKPRWIPLDDEAAEFLISIAAGRPAHEPLFKRADGGRWGKSHQRRPLLDACTKANIEPAIGFHVLRHTWASLRIMKRLPLMVAAEVLGHTDTRMVEKHYGHLSRDFIHEAVRSTALKLGPVKSNVKQFRPGEAA